ncbi:hypothetical protein J6590_009867 [Homalodisca vitripennis]|nr:hypothetical protein J6590_009867 [Homalodisca vitripennis]
MRSAEQADGGSRGGRGATLVTGNRQQPMIHPVPVPQAEYFIITDTARGRGRGNIPTERASISRGPHTVRCRHLHTRPDIVAVHASTSTYGLMATFHPCGQLPTCRKWKWKF